MNNADVVMKVAEKSGLAINICEKVIKAFEKQSGYALIGNLKGAKNSRADMLTSISEKTGFVLMDCEKVLTAFEEVVSTGLSDKLKFLSK